MASLRNRTLTENSEPYTREHHNAFDNNNAPDNNEEEKAIEVAVAITAEEISETQTEHSWFGLLSGWSGATMMGGGIGTIFGWLCLKPELFPEYQKTLLQVVQWTGILRTVGDFFDFILNPSNYQTIGEMRINISLWDMITSLLKTGLVINAISLEPYESKLGPSLSFLTISAINLLTMALKSQNTSDKRIALHLATEISIVGGVFADFLPPTAQALPDGVKRTLSLFATALPFATACIGAIDLAQPTYTKLMGLIGHFRSKPSIEAPSAVNESLLNKIPHKNQMSPT